MVVQCTLYEIYHLKLCNFVAVECVKMSPLSCSWTLFATQRESPCPVTPILLTPSPWHPLLSSQFLWICLVYTLHINGIIPYVTLCAWFLSRCCSQDSSLLCVTMFIRLLCDRRWFTPSAVGGQLGLVPILATENSVLWTSSLLLWILWCTRVCVPVEY